jgi:hypothetical protein
MADGQLAVNTEATSPGLFFKNASGNLVKVGPVHVGTTAPNASPASGGETGNTLGEQWLDTTGGTYVFKVWDGSAWRSETGTFVDVNGDTMTGALGVIAGSASTPGLFVSGDTNTGIYSPGADQVAISTNGTQRLLIDSSGNVNIDSNTLYVDATNNRVGLGTSSPQSRLHIDGAEDSTGGIVLSAGAQNHQWFLSSDFVNVHNIATSSASAAHTWQTNSLERVRIDASGRLLVGTSSALSTFSGSLGAARLQLEGAGLGAWASITQVEAGAGPATFVLAKTRSTGNTIVQSGDIVGAIAFQGNDGTDFVETAIIKAEVDGTPGTNDMPGRLVFSTTADGASSPTERMRITSGGTVGINTTSAGGWSGGSQLESLTTGSGKWAVSAYNTGTGGTGGCLLVRVDSTSETLASWRNGVAIIGSVTAGASSVAYNTSSDYRLKENVVPLTGAIGRVSQLQVHRFNFIADPDKTVDGFLAHEAQAVVPECVTGSKDEEDENGNPIYQGIDQSKLVPLLTAALQEAIAKIETLEAKVTALEAV